MYDKFYFFKGRVALYALLKAFGVGAGHRVLLPGYTCIVVPSAVRYLGAISEYTDIDMQSYNSLLPNYESVYARMVDEGTAGSLKAVIIQHTYGNPNRDTKAIVAWARQKGLYVIEDCAHANGVTIDGQPAGNFGDGAFFSTQWSKPFTTGMGGIAQLNNFNFADEMAALEDSAPSPGLKESLILALQLLAHKLLLRPGIYWFALNSQRALAKAGFFVGSSTTCELEGEMPADYFKGMGWLQRWLLERRGSKMEMLNAHRIWLAGEYDRLLAERGLPPFARKEGAVLIRYPVRVKDRSACLAAAEKARIELGDWFNHPLHPAGCNLTGLNWSDDLCPNAVTAANNTVNLPLHIRINGREARRIVDFVAEYATC